MLGGSWEVRSGFEKENVSELSVSEKKPLSVLTLWEPWVTSERAIWVRRKCSRERKGWGPQATASNSFSFSIIWTRGCYVAHSVNEVPETIPTIITITQAARRSPSTSVSGLSCCCFPRLFSKHVGHPRSTHPTWLHSANPNSPGVWKLDLHTEL